jgi:hypothetical protein
MTAPATSIPSLSKKQLAILTKPGPFRVYGIIATQGGKGVGLKLIDPKVKGVMHDVADALLQKKAKEGGEYVIEDPRTTQILWTTAGPRQ